MTKDERLEFRTSGNAALMIKELAKAEGTSVSEITRRLVNRSLDNIYEDTRSELDNLDQNILEIERDLGKLKRRREMLRKKVRGET